MSRLLWYKRIFFALMVAMVFSSVPAMAAPAPGPSGMAFYTPPSPLPPGAHGDLIWYRPASATPPGAPDAYTWNVLYRSIDGLGNPNLVTGTVLVPKAPWTNLFTRRPIVIYAVGTHGLGQSCAPSIQLENGTDYENANITAALKAGYAVLVTDNPGYTTGNVPSYMVGTAQGHAALDIAKAALQIPSITISKYAKVGIWGYSQGGQTAVWAGQLQPTYMPDLNLVGVAAGGVPADLIEVGNYIDGNVGSAFLLQVIMGLWAQYPEDIPLYSMANETGLAAMDAVQNMCVFEALFEFMNLSISELVIGNPTLSELIDEYVYGQLTSQKLGDIKIKSPVYLYHGTADEFIPLEQHLLLKEKFCSMGVNVSFGVYPGEHIITQFQAAPYVLSWLKDRFNGRWLANTCSTSNPRPVTTANPLDGDFIVSLNQWPLDARVHLKTLNQDVNMPDTSTFTADTNMITNVIDGSLSVPDFYTPIWIAIIPLSVKLGIVPAEPMVGEVSLDSMGQLHVQGHAYTTIQIKTAGISVIQIPFGCETESSVDFPLDFDGPISSLGNGNLTFSGTTTFPPMTGCGMFNALFTTLMSGPGQTFSFNVSPPEPATW